MGVFGVVVAGLVAILGLILIVHDKVRESRRLDDITLSGSDERQNENSEEP